MIDKQEGDFIKKPKLIIFDMDGLIFDSERLFMRELGKVMKDYGYELTEEIYIQLLGLNSNFLRDEMLNIYGREYPIEETSIKARENMTVCAEKGELKIKDGIKELLEFLKNENIPCTVASSTASKYVKEYLQIAGLDGYFSNITGGEEVSKSKPEPDIFLTACGKFNVKPSDALVLEDSENGIKAAHNAGIPVICIPDMKYPSREHIGITKLCIDRADKLIDYLKN